MLPELRERLNAWKRQADVVKRAEAEYLELEGSEKSLAGQLYLISEGNNVMEKQSRSYANDDWRDFKKGLAQAKTRFNHERRILEMYGKAFDAEYLTIKLENQYRDR